jgi:hypothetical protein
MAYTFHQVHMYSYKLLVVVFLVVVFLAVVLVEALLVEASAVASAVASPAEESAAVYFHKNMDYLICLFH